MGDPDNPVGMVHDGYLKLFQLSQPVLTGFDSSLVRRGPGRQSGHAGHCPAAIHAPQVIVGDRHQQIYGWRGAQNALDALQPTTTRYLTRSFRFGPPIAALANRAGPRPTRARPWLWLASVTAGGWVTSTVAVSIP